MPDWLFDKLLDPRVWLALLYTVFRSVVLLLQYLEYRQHRNLVGVSAAIGTNGTVQLDVTNRTENDLSVGRVTLLRDRSRFRHFLRKYLLGVERWVSMDIVEWRGPDKKLNKVKRHSNSKPRYFQLKATSDKERTELVSELSSSWFRQTKVRIEIGGYRILSKVEFVGGPVVPRNPAKQYAGESE